MDPSAPNYDRPPSRRRLLEARRRPTRIGDAIVPPKDPGFYRNPGPPTARDALQGAASLHGAQQLGMAQGPQKGQIGTVDRFKAAGLEPPKNAQEIGFFNATHKHGEPLENLIAKLRDRIKGRKPPAAASYTPNGSISSSR